MENIFHVWTRQIGSEGNVKGKIDGGIDDKGLWDACGRTLRSTKLLRGRHSGVRSGHAKGGGGHAVPAMASLACEVGDFMHFETLPEILDSESR
jgi:hypothetical protein